MSRFLHWSLLVGCLGVVALTLRPAWDVACCPSPLSALISQGRSVQLAGSPSDTASGPLENEQLSSAEGLVLVESR